MTKIAGIKIVWDCPQVMSPIVVDRRVPDGKIRLRFRVGSPAKAFIRTEKEIFVYLIKDEEIRWCIGPDLCQGINNTL